MRTTLSLANLAARAVLEVGIVAATAWYGYTLAGDTPTRLALAVLVPLAVFGFWATVDFRFAGRRGETLRLLQELVVTAVASGALYESGHHILAGALLALSVVHHAAVYLLGERLLKPHPASHAAPENAQPILARSE